MLSLTVFMVVVLALCAAVAGVVVIGMQGRGRARLPKVAATMSKAARHLNGDAQPPKAVRRLLAYLPAFR